MNRIWKSQNLETNESPIGERETTRAKEQVQVSQPMSTNIHVSGINDQP
jgi:hypothetical protein